MGEMQGDIGRCGEIARLLELIARRGEGGGGALACAAQLDLRERNLAVERLLRRLRLRALLLQQLRLQHG